MTNEDVFMLALTMWRENRGGGVQGMQSVGNVILNRAALRKTSPYAECVRPEQFSSITAPGDPQLAKWPSEVDPQWRLALQLAQEAFHTLPDITDGATNYYALSMTTPPKWASEMERTVEIAGQVFFKPTGGN